MKVRWRGVIRSIGVMLCMMLIYMAMPAVAEETTQTVELDVSKGIIEISATGYSVGGGTETAYTGDYVLTTTTETAAESRVQVTGGTHNITLNGCNITYTYSPFLLSSGVSVKLILQGENTLKATDQSFTSSYASAGIEVPTGATLTITESTDGGKLTVTGGSNGAGIGGSAKNDCGNIIIVSGHIIAQGGEEGAGIGGGYEKNSGTITISGGKVEATGGYRAAGIGSGSGGTGKGVVKIIDGTVTATGGYLAAGIGSGRSSTGLTVEISGGVVQATGDTDGAGIGAGNFYTQIVTGEEGSCFITINDGIITATGGAGIGGDYAEICINGGTVTATGNEDSACNMNAIGGLYYKNITINGGTVTATGGTDGAGIGGREDTDSKIEITGGTITATGGQYGAGIGGGKEDDANIINISGGNITAKATGYGAGIGGGAANYNIYTGDISGGSGGTITISGGTINATSKDSSGIGVGTCYDKPEKTGKSANVIITGGNIITSANRNFPSLIYLSDIATGSGSLTNGSGEAVSMVVIQGVSSLTDIASIDSPASYGFNDVEPLSGKLYLYVPKSANPQVLTAKDGTTYMGKISEETSNGYFYKHTHNSNGEITYNKTADTHTPVQMCAGCPIDYGNPGVAENHGFDYSVSNNVITKKCDTCEYEETLTLIAPENLVYDGTAKIATCENNIKGETVFEITYCHSEGCVDAGEHTARVTLTIGEDETYTATINFTVAQKELIVTEISVLDREYDGTNRVEISDITLDGVIAGDDISLGAGYYGTLPDSKITDSEDGTDTLYTSVTLNSLTLSGADTENYKIADTVVVENCSVSIWRRSITIQAEDQEVSLNEKLDPNGYKISEYSLSSLAEGNKISSITLSGDTSVGTTMGVIVVSDATIVDAQGNDVTDNYAISYRDGDLVVKCTDHDEFDNGFCKICDGYQEAVWNEEDAVYEISNAGQLYWYAQYLNTTKAEIHAELTADIEIPENASNWEPINASYVYFNGNYHTISGLKCIGGDMTYVGLFGNEIWWYDISNLHITDSYFEGRKYVGAVVACMNNGGSVNNCHVTNTTVKGDSSNVGGLVGYLGISNVINCYSVATIVGENGKVLIGNGYGRIENSYYLSETETEDGGKTAEQFASGEVAYLLQAGVKGEYLGYDENYNPIYGVAPQIWYQSIDNGNPPDKYPVLKATGNNVVYRVNMELSCTEETMKTYSNKNETVTQAHFYENGVCEGCGIFEDGIGASLRGYTISLSGNIAINFYMELSDDILKDEGAYMQFVLPGANHTQEKIFVSDAVQKTMSGKVYYVFSCGVAAKDMTSEIKAQIVLPDGSKGAEYTYTVREYADYIIAHPETYSSETIAMVTAMMNYGGYVQTYFNHNMDKLANAGLESILPDVSIGDDFKYVEEGSVEGLTFAGTTLMFTTETRIRQYFELGDGKNINDFTFVYNNTTLTPVQSGNYYYVEINNISAMNLSDMYTLSVNQDAYKLTYSPYTYIRSILERKYADSIKNAMKAMYHYCESTKAYFKSLQ